MTTTVNTPSADALVIIPARGGSQGIPLKNLQPVAGRSLVERAITSCLHVQPRAVVVSTDHPLIAEAAVTHGASVIHRHAATATHEASSESAVLDALDQWQTAGHSMPAITVLVQCTSPFINPAALASAIQRVSDGDADVIFSGVLDHGFRWTVTDQGDAHPLGHSRQSRPRRQDLPTTVRETGAFYVMRTEGLRDHGSRFFGTVGVELVPTDQAVEIDEPLDLDIAQRLARDEHAPHPHDHIDVDALVTDFDGVHTNDRAHLDEHGNEYVTVNRRDGMGVARLRNLGIPMLILSTERHPIVRARAKKLAVDVLHGVDDKADALRTWMSAQRLDPSRVAYVGNDINDLPAMALVGWPIATADAEPAVKAAARIILDHRGGDGAVREITDRIRYARLTPPSPVIPPEPSHTPTPACDTQPQPARS